MTFFRNTMRASAAVAAVLALSGPVSAATTQGTLPAGWTAVGNAGSGTPDGDVTAPPTVSGTYTYVSTEGGVTGIGALAGVGGTGSPANGSTLTTSLFSAAANDTLQFFFNYVTSDGSGFADYAWARLLDNAGAQAALLFTARTTPGGDTVPGSNMPTPEATLVPASTPINDGASNWSALGSNSGACFSGVGNGCGSTGWIESDFTIATAGNYQLQFGVTNWDDTAFGSGMAIAGANIGGTPIDPNDPPSTPAIPLPAAGWLMITGLGGLAMLRRRRKAA